MGYGYGFYRDAATETVGMWFGFGQVQIARWSVTLCLFKFRIPDSPELWNRYWFTLGKAR